MTLKPSYRCSCRITNSTTTKCNDDDDLRSMTNTSVSRNSHQVGNNDNRLSIQLLICAVLALSALLVTQLNQPNMGVNGELNIPELPSLNLSELSKKQMPNISNDIWSGLEIFRKRFDKLRNYVNETSTVLREQKPLPTSSSSSSYDLFGGVRSLGQSAFFGVRNRIYYRKEQIGNMTADWLDGIRTRFSQQGEKSGNETTREYWFGYRDWMDSVIQSVRKWIDCLRKQRLGEGTTEQQQQQQQQHARKMLNKTKELLKKMSPDGAIDQLTFDKLLEAENEVDAIVERKQLPNNLKGLIETLQELQNHP